MNPDIPADYEELGRWLRQFATSHAKREALTAEASVQMDQSGEGRAYGLRLAVGAATWPAAGQAPLELAVPEVASGRTRFAWCAELAARLRRETARLAREGTAPAAPGTEGSWPGNTRPEP